METMFRAALQFLREPCDMNLIEDGLQSCIRQHAVRIRHARDRFCLPSFGLVRAQRGAGQRLTAACRGLKQLTSTITRRFLRAQAPVCLDRDQRSVTLRETEAFEVAFVGRLWRNHDLRARGVAQHLSTSARRSVDHRRRPVRSRQRSGPAKARPGADHPRPER